MRPPSVSGYEILEPLGEGGMGRVYKARDLRLGRLVALKLLSQKLSRDTIAHARFVKEAQMAASVEHPNVCAIFEIGEDEAGDPFIAMSYCPGPTLQERLDQGSFSPDETRGIAEQVAEALGAAHERGIVHRDIKPSNISFSDKGVLKVLDFGIASIRCGPETTSDLDILGTVAYMSPEQLQGSGTDARSDIWALGVVLYECLVGVHPFRAPYDQATIYNILNSDPKPVSELNREIPPNWQSLLSKCLERDPELRFSNMAELQEALSILSTESGGLPGQAVEPDPEPQNLFDFRGNLPALSKEFVGRAGFRDALINLVGSTTGPVTTALVSGESGIGKSQLVISALRETEQTGIRVLFGRCVFNEGVLPYHPFVTALKQGFGVSSLNLTAHLEQLANQLGGDLRGRIAFLRAFFAASDDSAGVLNREQLWDSVLSLYRALASEQKRLVIVVDDLQWADESTLAFFSFLVRSTAADPIRLIGIYRLDAAASHGATTHDRLVESLRQLRIEGSVREIEIPRLDEKESAELVQALFDHQPISDDIASAIFEKTSGHPLFISEMVNLVRHENIVTRDNGVWQLVAQRPELDVLPQRVQDVIQQRLGILDPTDRELLEVAAIEGERFTSEAVAHCLGWTRIQLLKRLQVLESQYRLIAHLDRGYRFDHALIRQALYDSVLPELRAEYHRMIADHLVERHDEDVDFASRISTHLKASGQPEKAIPYLVKSAARARSVYALNQALATYNEINEIVLEIGISDPELQLKVEIALGDIHYLMGNVSESVRCLTNSVESARRAADTASEFETTRKLALCRRLQGKLDEAMDLARTALDLALGGEDTELVVKARHTLTDVHSSKGEYALAIEHATKALTLSEQSNDLSGKSIAQSNLGFSHWHMGEIHQSMEFFLAAQATQRAIGDRSGLAMTLNFLALAIWKLGHYEDAIASASESVEIKRQINLQRAIPGSLNILGDVYRDLHEIDRALDYHHESLSLARSHGNKGAMCDNLRDLGADHLVAGDTEKAADYFGQALDLATTAGIKWYQTRSQIGIAEAALSRGDTDTATEHAEKGHALAGEIGARELLIEATWTLARSSGSDIEKSVELLGNALAEAAELGLNTLKWQIQLDLSDALEQLGNDEPAMKHRREAAATLENIAGRISDSELRKRFTSAPDVARCLAYI